METVPVAWTRMEEQDVTTGRRITCRAEGPAGAGTGELEAWNMPRSHPAFHCPGEEAEKRNRMEKESGGGEMSPEWGRT